MIEAGLISAIGFIIIMMRLNLRRICGYAIVFDIAITALLVFMFQGTYAGMMTGLFAEIIISLFLTSVKKLYGFERAVVMRLEGNLLPSVIWVQYPGKLTAKEWSR